MFLMLLKVYGDFGYTGSQQTKTVRRLLKNIQIVGKTEKTLKEKHLESRKDMFQVLWLVEVSFIENMISTTITKIIKKSTGIRTLFPLFFRPVFQPTPIKK